MTELYRM